MKICTYGMDPATGKVLCTISQNGITRQGSGETKHEAHNEARAKIMVAAAAASVESDLRVAPAQS